LGGVYSGIYEFHIFKVASQVMWVRSIDFTVAFNLTYFSYNFLERKCVYLEYRTRNNSLETQEEIEILGVFDLKNFRVSGQRTGVYRDAVYEKRVVKALLAGQEVVVGMTAEKRLTMYHVGRRVQPVRVLEFEDLRNFDVFENKYLLLYQGSNQINVFTLEKELELTFKMRLPLYSAYESYAFMYGYEFNRDAPA
jgi:hypothetical protein